MRQQFARIAALDKGKGYFGNGRFFERSIEAGVAVDLVKILYGEEIVGAFVFQEVVAFGSNAAA
jgi:hypothetical protein